MQEQRLACVQEKGQMGIFDWFGTKTISGLSGPIDSIGNLYTTDKARLEGEKGLVETAQKTDLETIQNNRLMILSGHFFNFGWQPLTGWTAGFCFALYWVPQLLVANYIWVSSCLQQHAIIGFPINPQDLFHLLYLLFGAGAMNFAHKKWL